jgi:hypothetical protein
MSVAPAAVPNPALGLLSLGGWDHYSFNLMMSIGIEQKGQMLLAAHQQQHTPRARHNLISKYRIELLPQAIGLGRCWFCHLMSRRLSAVENAQYCHGKD